MISWPPSIPAPVTPTPGWSSFTYTDGSQWFIVPDGVNAVAIDAYGAQGGDVAYGGPGGRVRATLAVSPGDVLQVNPTAAAAAQEALLDEDSGI